MAELAVRETMELTPSLVTATIVFFKIIVHARSELTQLVECFPVYPKVAV